MTHRWFCGAFTELNKAYQIIRQTITLGFKDFHLFAHVGVSNHATVYFGNDSNSGDAFIYLAPTRGKSLSLSWKTRE